MPEPKDHDHDHATCARCGGDTTYVRCDQCDEFGMSGHDCGEDSCCCAAPEENMPCGVCNGVGGWQVCGNSEAWCQAHPRAGAEAVQRGTIVRVPCALSAEDCR